MVGFTKGNRLFAFGNVREVDAPYCYRKDERLDYETALPMQVRSPRP